MVIKVILTGDKRIMCAQAIGLGFISFLLIVSNAISVFAQVPSYRVDVVAQFNTTTSLGGASENGFFVGSQVVNSQIRAYIADLENDLTLLPLPSNYISSLAFDVNCFGEVVGTVADDNFPFDHGHPAIWIPIEGGGYSVEFLTTLSEWQGHSIDGGQATHINDRGDILGFSRIQGFQGGPTTYFSQSDDPTDLSELGFGESAGALNELGTIVGGGLRMELDTGTIVDLGVPDPVGTVNFNFVLGYAINDVNEVVVAARRATSTDSAYVTYLNNDVDGWQPVDPSESGTSDPSFYDNNNAGDVVYSQRILFRAENQIIHDVNLLLDAQFSNWFVNAGFMDNQRRIATVGFDNISGQNALLILTPLEVELLLGDINRDGTVNLLDVALFVDLLVSSGFQIEADINQDGVVDLLDVQPFVDLLIS